MLDARRRLSGPPFPAWLAIPTGGAVMAEKAARLWVIDAAEAQAATGADPSLPALSPHSEVQPAPKRPASVVDDVEASPSERR